MALTVLWQWVSVGVGVVGIVMIGIGGESIMITRAKTYTPKKKIVEVITKHGATIKAIKKTCVKTKMKHQLHRNKREKYM